MDIRSFFRGGAGGGAKKSANTDEPIMKVETKSPVKGTAAAAISPKVAGSAKQTKVRRSTTSHYLPSCSLCSFRAALVGYWQYFITSKDMSRGEYAQISGRSLKSSSRSPAEGSSHSVSPPAAFLCAISSEIMSDPVVTCDGQSYERSAIEVENALSLLH